MHIYEHVAQQDGLGGSVQCVGGGGGGTSGGVWGGIFFYKKKN